MTKAIIFDFFGVICRDMYLDWQRAQQIDSAAASKYQAISDQVDRGGYSTDQLFQLISRESGVPAAAIKADFEGDVWLDTQLLDYIGDLHHRYRIGLLTNSVADMVSDIISENHLKDHFDTVVISGEVGLIKPQPEIFKLTLKRLSVDRTEAIFIDDRVRHVEAARQFGLDSIQYQGLSQLKTELAHRGIE
jgi:FMN phosphatase YigB (HAD superfamily)